MSTTMNQADANPDPLVTAAETAWLEYAKGTYSNTDKRIFVEGFRRGWRARLHQVTSVSEDDAREYLHESNR